MCLWKRVAVPFGQAAEQSGGCRKKAALEPVFSWPVLDKEFLYQPCLNLPNRIRVFLCNSQHFCVLYAVLRNKDKLLGVT